MNKIFACTVNINGIIKFELSMKCLIHTHVFGCGAEQFAQLDNRTFQLLSVDVY